MFKVKTSRLNKNEVLKKLNIDENKNYKYLLTDDYENFEKDKINIIFSEDNLEDVKKIVKAIIMGEDYIINVRCQEGIKKVNVKTIEYFEAFDNEVYAIVGKERYIVLEKLYALESELEEHNFVRISKSYLVNIANINYIKPLLNYKLKLVMNNGDIIEVNRTYTKSFKERISL